MNPVKRAPIDAENLGGARAITAGDLEYRPLSIQQMAHDYADVARALRVYAKVESAAPVYVYGWSLGAGFAVAVGFDVQTRANWAGVISIGLPNRTSSSVVLAQITQT